LTRQTEELQVEGAGGVELDSEIGGACQAEPDPAAATLNL
jgi:hypothetical protein